jgi:broad specificity phosphatase PhoE
MKRVSLVRHGVTDRNIAGVFSGMGTEGITAEARRLLEAATFEIESYDAVHCSPAVRCVETARALGTGNFATDPRLAERDFGVFDGLTPAECQRRYPAEFEAFRRLDAGYAMPDGESRADHFGRIMSWLDDLAANSNVLAVTHGGTIDFLYRLGRGLELHGGGRVHAGPHAAITVVEVDGSEMVLVEFGRPL